MLDKPCHHRPQMRNGDPQFLGPVSELEPDRPATLHPAGQDVQHIPGDPVVTVALPSASSSLHTSKEAGGHPRRPVDDAEVETVMTTPALQAA
ncbi:hypothetical protein [Streptomyces sp. NPDC056401]|uniref:hypothetical protein n=1 Tax=Streptomyces sp. NPDC056401 TaxID=3345809 RepID=UPI0035DCEFD5